MKRMILIICTLAVTTLSNAMSMSKVRTETRFLTDKMVYELGLNNQQYNDVYEINFDFIYGVSDLMKDVLRGYSWAIDRYYDYLDIRNDDLRWVLNRTQYTRFMGADYFFRPIYTNGSRWHFRVYINYNNPSVYYYPRPYHYNSYCGGHYRTNHRNESYYRGRYNNQPYYSGVYRTRENSSTYTTHRRSDFSSVKIRPNSDNAPQRRETNTPRRETPARPTNRTTRESDENRGNGSSRSSSVRSSENSRSRGNSSSSSVRSTENGSTRSNSSSSSSGSTRTTRPTRNSDGGR